MISFSKRGPDAEGWRLVVDKCFWRQCPLSLVAIAKANPRGSSGKVLQLLCERATVLRGVGSKFAAFVAGLWATAHSTAPVRVFLSSAR